MRPRPEDEQLQITADTAATGYGRRSSTPKVMATRVDNTPSTMAAASRSASRPPACQGTVIGRRAGNVHRIEPPPSSVRKGENRRCNRGEKSRGENKRTMVHRRRWPLAPGRPIPLNNSSMRRPTRPVKKNVDILIPPDPAHGPLIGRPTPPLNYVRFIVSASPRVRVSNPPALSNSLTPHPDYRSTGHTSGPFPTGPGTMSRTD